MREFTLILHCDLSSERYGSFLEDDLLVARSCPEPVELGGETGLEIGSLLLWLSSCSSAEVLNRLLKRKRK